MIMIVCHLTGLLPFFISVRRGKKKDIRCNCSLIGRKKKKDFDIDLKRTDDIISSPCF